jgi:hypothetical protein
MHVVEVVFASVGMQYLRSDCVHAWSAPAHGEQIFPKALLQ